ncbi:endo-1,31,4-beta-D-glucanase-like [Quillaja saponaria]|uniref:Endo-1,31,4-beta-D-glucanase-like n=1 Tax=Quillaja saponaria TaxID=32244 RepID=A0AAD7QF58_QUISA|nr:endo-1,31,4-beta-D-glucanase-like [Quillaja saponaria]
MVLGFEALNLRKLADKVAASTGFLVVVPDLLYGDYYDLDKPQFDLKSWLKAHREDKGYKDTKPLIAALKSKGISAIGVAGTVVAKLANSNDIQAAVVLHPGPTTNGDINNVKVPIAILAAEIDEFCPAEQVKQFAEMLALKSDQFDSFVKIYPGVVHG